MSKCKDLNEKFTDLSEGKSLSDVQAIMKADMKKWLGTGDDNGVFAQYNDLMDSMAKINIRDDDIAKEWKKVDKAFDAIIKIATKKGYLK